VAERPWEFESPLSHPCDLQKTRSDVPQAAGFERYRVAGMDLCRVTHDAKSSECTLEHQLVTWPVLTDDLRTCSLDQVAQDKCDDDQIVEGFDHRKDVRPQVDQRDHPRGRERHQDLGSAWNP